MASKATIQQPQSQAGILGVSANTNMGGMKFNPKGFVVAAVLFVLILKIIGKIISM
ncbi:MAG: hypothetical protein ABIH83_04535 [Candidatus Micrarchaeota archaeon]